MPTPFPPRQAAPVEGSPVYKAEYEQAYAGYDVDQANALLDGLGLTERNSDGIRLREAEPYLQSYEIRLPAS